MDSSPTIEKPFKCTVCSQCFTNEDHLDVHRRRHEMSLNLGRISHNDNVRNDGTGSENLLQQQLLQPSSTGEDAFADQTPTPTRFFRIAEEVGFFQDLQNVNPFDEQFAKATNTSSTSGLAESPASPISPFRGLTESTNNDNLDTPQIIGIPLTTPTPNPIITSLHPIITVEDNEPLSHNEEILKPSLDNGSPSEVMNLKASIEESAEPAEVVTTTQCGLSFTNFAQDKKNEILERNRAAAVRSRQRRKQWISELELKNKQLSLLLAASEGQLRKVREENSHLREELNRHSNCKLTVSKVSANHSPIVRLSPPFHPSILKTSSIKPNNLSSSSNFIPSSIESTSIVLPSSRAEILTSKPLQLPTKRGRPRKGEEKRPCLLLPRRDGGPPVKVQILLPLPSSTKINLATVTAFSNP